MVVPAAMDALETELESESGSDGPSPEERLRALLEVLPVGVVLLAPDQTVRAMNAAALSFMGIASLEDVVGSSFADLVKPDSTDPLDRFISVVAGGSPDRVRIGARSDVGVSLELKAVPFQASAEEAPSILGVLQVVQEPAVIRREPQATYQAPAASGPAGSAGERFASRQSRKVGHLALALVGDIDRSVGEIGDLLERVSVSGAPSESVHQDIELGRRAVGRVQSLARRFTTFGAEGTRVPEPIIVDQMISDFEQVLARLAGDGAELVLKLDAPEAPVRASRENLERALTILVVEARAALPIGGSIAISTSDASDENGPIVRVQVDAEGYAAEQLEPNSALGRILEDIGGSIQAGSGEPGKGHPVCLPREPAGRLDSRSGQAHRAIPHLRRTRSPQ